MGSILGNYRQGGSRVRPPEVPGSAVSDLLDIAVEALVAGMAKDEEDAIKKQHAGGCPVCGTTENLCPGCGYCSEHHNESLYEFMREQGYDGMPVTEVLATLIDAVLSGEGVELDIEHLETSLMIMRVVIESADEHGNMSLAGLRKLEKRTRSRRAKQQTGDDRKSVSDLFGELLV